MPLVCDSRRRNVIAAIFSWSGFAQFHGGRNGPIGESRPCWRLGSTCRRSAITRIAASAVTTLLTLATVILVDGVKPAAESALVRALPYASDLMLEHPPR